MSILKFNPPLSMIHKNKDSFSFIYAIKGTQQTADANTC
jgi:hypothetical protein